MHVYPLAWLVCRGVPCGGRGCAARGAGALAGECERPTRRAHSMQMLGAGFPGKVSPSASFDGSESLTSDFSDGLGPCTFAGQWDLMGNRRELWGQSSGQEGVVQYHVVTARAGSVGAAGHSPPFTSMFSLRTSEVCAEGWGRFVLRVSMFYVTASFLFLFFFIHSSFPIENFKSNLFLHSLFFNQTIFLVVFTC